MQDKIDTVRTISRTINTAELRAADSFERSVAVMTAVLAARKHHGLPVTFGVGALSRAAAATHSYAEGNRALAECHQLLADDQAEFGVPRMGGDDCPWPSLRGDEQRAGEGLRLVG